MSRRRRVSKIIYMLDKSSLSEKAFTILKHIAEGHSYEQILALSPDWTYIDICEAAGEALAKLQGTNQAVSKQKRKIIELRRPRSNAYQHLSAAEDLYLNDLLATTTMEGVSEMLKHNPGALRRHLSKLGLTAAIQDSSEIPRVMVQNID